MLAVAASPGEIAPYLGPDIALAAVNGPRQVMIAGADAQLAAVTRRIAADGLTYRPVRTTSAFHSPVVANAARRCLLGAARWPPQAPVLPLWSGYTGARLDDTMAEDPEFWVDQPAAAVHFWPALQDLMAHLTARHGNLHLVEAGPSQGLSSIARRHPTVSRGGSRAVAMLPARRRDDAADLAAIAAVRSLLCTVESVESHSRALLARPQQFPRR
jgi:acyl transferase domain-containing protein